MKPLLLCLLLLAGCASVPPAAQQTGRPREYPMPAVSFAVGYTLEGVLVRLRPGERLVIMDVEPATGLYLARRIDSDDSLIRIRLSAIGAGF